ncbi:MAG: hypothetical protein R3F55_08890 [Alphaproteobacteria bacterium]
MRNAMLATAAAALALSMGTALAQDQNMVHAHIGHVMTAWNDTPDGMGLLPAAQAEAAIALQHADLALEDPTDLDAVRLHLGHVVNALDPSMEANGPGRGYGVVAAASGAGKHAGFAAEVEGASDAVQTHAVHVQTSTANVVGWAEAAAAMAQAARGSDSAGQVVAAAIQVRAMVDAMVNGTDANGDGTVGWEQGEGGLAQAEAHMGFMMEAEGLR